MWERKQGGVFGKKGKIFVTSGSWICSHRVMSQSLNLSPEKEVVLVRKARGGDERAFVELVRGYQNLVTSVTLSILGERMMSEDAAQETFVRAWKGLGQLKEDRKFRSWLMAIARRSALRMLPNRKRAKQQLLQDCLLYTSPSPRDQRGSRMPSSA